MMMKLATATLFTLYLCLKLAMAATSSKDQQRTCDLPSGDFECAMVAVVAGAYYTTSSKNDTETQPTKLTGVRGSKKKFNNEIATCILPDGSVLEFGRNVKPIGNLLFKCASLATPSLCLRKGFQQFELPGNGQFSCYHNLTTKHTTIQRQACFNSETLLFKPVTTMVPYTTEKPFDRAVCSQLGTVSTTSGCIDSEGKHRDIGSSWMVMSQEFGNHSVGHKESCVENGTSNSGKIEVDYCFIGNQVYSVGIVHSEARQLTYNYDDALLKFVRTSDSRHANYDFWCSSTKGLRRACLDSQGAPKLVGTKWIDLSGIFRCDTFEATLVTAVWEVCIIDNRVLKHGCGYYRGLSQIAKCYDPRKLRSKDVHLCDFIENAPLLDNSTIADLPITGSCEGCVNDLAYGNAAWEKLVPKPE